MNANLAVIQPTSTPMVHTMEWNEEQKQLIKSTVAKDATDAELSHFFQVCKARNLNPFTKEIWFIKRGGAPTIQVSIDGLRVIAHRTGKLTGIKRGVEKRGDDTIAWAEVYRSDWQFPAREEVYLSEYKSLNTPLWRSMPNQMLKKCAEAHALRMAFPESMSGLYTHEEMSQADDKMVVDACYQEAKAAHAATQEQNAEKMRHLFNCIGRVIKDYSLSDEAVESATGLTIDELRASRDLEELEEAFSSLNEYTLAVRELVSFEVTEATVIEECQDRQE